MDILTALSVKWWAVLIGIVVNFVVGMLWYGPFFGKVWMKLVGLTQEEIQEGGSSPIYLFSVLTAIISTYVLGVLLNLVNTQTIPAAIGVGLLLWLGIFLAPTVNHNLYESRPAKLLLINGFYDFTTIFIVSIVLQLSR